MSDRAVPAPPHPLWLAGRMLLSDLLSTLVFVGLYAATHSAYAATGLAVAVGLGRILWQSRHHIAIDAMQWLSLLLVIVFGGAALVSHNPAFIMLKPSLVYAAIGTVMLRRGWMNRYVPPIVQDRGADLVTVFGYLWAALMFATSAANALVVWYGSAATWAWFIGVVPIASKAALILLQFAILRTLIRRRIRTMKMIAAPAG